MAGGAAETGRRGAGRIALPAQSVDSGPGAIGEKQAAPTFPVHSNLASGRSAAEVPVVGPVTPKGWQTVGVSADDVPPLAGQGEPQARLAAVGVPAPHKLGKVRLGGAVIAERIVDLQHQGRQGIANLGEPGSHPRPPLGGEKVGVLADPHPPSQAVGEAVPGEDRPPARSLPVEREGMRIERSTEVGVDRHTERRDVQVGEDVHQGPVLAIHIAIHGVANRQSELRADPPQGTKALDQLIGIVKGSDVTEHRGDLDPAGLHQVDEARNLAVRCRLEPVAQHAGRLDGPPEGVVPVVVQVPLAEGQRRVQEAPMEIPDNRLIVGIADVGVAVVNEINRFYRRAGHHQPPIGRPNLPVRSTRYARHNGAACSKE